MPSARPSAQRSDDEGADCPPRSRKHSRLRLYGTEQDHVTGEAEWMGEQRSFQAEVILGESEIPSDVWVVRRWRGSMNTRSHRRRWWPRRTLVDADTEAWLVAIHPSDAVVGDRPRCIVGVSEADADHLPVEGTAVVVGRPSSGAHLGLFTAGYMVWPLGPPRPPRDEDPGWGDEPATP